MDFENSQKVAERADFHGKVSKITGVIPKNQGQNVIVKIAQRVSGIRDTLIFKLFALKIKVTSERRFKTWYFIAYIGIAWIDKVS